MDSIVWRGSRPVPELCDAHSENPGHRGPAALALTLLASAPASAQSYRDYRDHDDDRGEDVLIGAAVGALAGAFIGDGDGRYVVGGAIAGAALGATANRDDRDRCDYRGNRCYRYDNDRYGYGYGYDRRDYRYDRRDYRRDRRDYRDYRHDRRW